MDSFRRAALGLACLAFVLVGADRAAGEEDDPCQCRDMIVTCSATPRQVVLGDAFEYCATVQSVADVTLEDVQLTIQPCPKAKPIGDAKLTITIPKLGKGQSYTHCVKFRCTEVGECRITAHAVDSTRIAASGCICSAFCRGLPALQVEMIDTALDRSAKGIFKLGEEFLYRLSVENDVGSALTPDLQVRWSLPVELEFVRGTGDRNATVSGAGQAATSSRFVLRPNEKVTFEVVCRVVQVPPRSLVQTRAAVVVDPSGDELAIETESTTLKR